MEKLVQSFWKELSEGLPKKTADSDLLGTYELQEKRLEEEDLELHIEAEPRGYFPDGRIIAGWEDKHYKTTLMMISAAYHRTFYPKGQSKPVKKFSDHYLLYSDITKCRDYAVSAEEPYICPNCGAISTLGKLQTDGCSYCGTRFAMSELYPKISGFYAIKEMGGTKEEVNADVFKYIKPIAAVFAVIGLIRACLEFDPESTVYSIANGAFYIIGGILLGCLAGYLIWCAKMMTRLFSEAGKGMPKLSALSSPKAFTKQMKQYSEEFSYEYFTDKVISILKTIIYSSDDKQIPNYLGEETTRFDHVVESSYTGALALKDFSIENNIVTVHVIAFMENFYNDHGHIRKKEEKIPLTVQKDLSADFNYHFHVRAVKCPSCGSSFDALSRRYCPYCGTPLDMRRQDWVIVRLD